MLAPTECEVELREIVAQTLWRDRYRLRNWQHAKKWAKNSCYERADKAIRRAGFENVKFLVKET